MKSFHLEAEGSSSRAPPSSSVPPSTTPSHHHVLPLSLTYLPSPSFLLLGPGGYVAAVKASQLGLKVRPLFQTRLGRIRDRSSKPELTSLSSSLPLRPNPDSLYRQARTSRRNLPQRRMHPLQGSVRVQSLRTRCNEEEGESKADLPLFLPPRPHRFSSTFQSRLLAQVPRGQARPEEEGN